MKTETNETTALEAATNEESPETSPIETVAGLEGNEVTADQDSVLDQESEDGDEVEASDPADPLFGDNAPTSSAAPRKNKLSMLIGAIMVLLTIVGVFGMSVLGTAVANYTDARWETDCVNGQRMEARIPSDFDGNLKAWAASGGKVTITGTCDNIAWQR
jgi:hypothetical protein